MRCFADTVRCIAVIISHDGIIESVSAGAEQLLGYPTRELVGRPITHIIADQSVFEIPSMMNAARERGCWEGDMFYRSRAGNSFDGRGSLTLLAGQTDAIAGFLLIGAPYNKGGGTALQGTAEMSEVGLRLRNLAHEMNNPLAVMMGFAQLLMLNSSCTGKLRTDMEKLYAEMQRVIHVAEKLHSYAVSLQDHRRLNSPKTTAHPDRPSRAGYNERSDQIQNDDKAETSGSKSTGSGAD